MADGADRVIVVGAGPVGLVATAALVAEGIPVTTLEATPDLAEDLRASTFHPPTLDMLDRFGISDQLVARGLVCRHWQFRDRREGVVATFDMALLEGETRHPYRLQCEQWKLTEALRALVDAHPDAELVTDARVEEVTQDDSGVTAVARRPDGSRDSFRGRFLIGADGARSTVRRCVGARFDGLTIPEIYLTLSTPFPFHEVMEDLANIAYISDPAEWLVLLRTPSLWRVLLPTDPALSDEEIVAPDRVEARLQGVVATGRPYEVVHRTAYRVHERVADRYVWGRIFLAGDAAHINNPLGGMGMNGGIHDAVNLTGKLAEVWRGAPLALMGRYERQRRKVALETVQAQALRNREMLNAADPERRRAYHDELRAIVADPARHKAHLMRSAMIQSLRDLEAVD
ncbi:MAG: FAD-dependent monooxygenase [Alphaproteobacteria bacterium]|nr:MAG: FAD-dependent monooxygenase [Alphaproteobacteria bacterium]